MNRVLAVLSWIYLCGMAGYGIVSCLQDMGYPNLWIIGLIVNLVAITLLVPRIDMIKE